jgi:hypothetical protein
MRAQAEGANVGASASTYRQRPVPTGRGQFAPPGKPAAAAADDTRDRPERRNPARSARNGNKTTETPGPPAGTYLLCQAEHVDAPVG